MANETLKCDVCGGPPDSWGNDNGRAWCLCAKHLTLTRPLHDESEPRMLGVLTLPDLGAVFAARLRRASAAPETVAYFERAVETTIAWFMGWPTPPDPRDAAVRQMHEDSLAAVRETARERDAARFRGEAVTAALSRLLDLEHGKCRLDHNGFCQEHGSGPECIVAYARAVLGRYGFPTTANGPPLPPPMSTEEARRVEGAAERCRWHRDLGGGESRHCAHPRPCPVHDDAIAPPKETP
jgi:hypothetical protein